MIIDCPSCDEPVGALVGFNQCLLCCCRFYLTKDGRVERLDENNDPYGNVMKETP